MTHELARAFLETLGDRAAAPAAVEVSDISALELELQALWERGQQAWPGVRLTGHDFARHLGQVLALPDNADQTLATLHTDDLYLARACAGGDPRAIAMCEERFADVIQRALRRQGVDPATQDDLRQSLREWLFVDQPDRRAQIVTYQGRGQLAGWLKVIVVRQALKTFRGKHRTRPLDDEAPVADSPAGDPEEQLSKLLFRSEFKDAFREAVATLPEEDRVLLGRNILQGVSIDVLGQELGVHRSTAARRVERARQSLFYAIRRSIMQRHQLDAAGYNSVLGLVHSQLELSVRMLLQRSE